jgi:hypothetical protein
VQPRVLTQVHNELGLKGVYAVRNYLQDCFWWPLMGCDVAWYIKTCHKCQAQHMGKYMLPLIVQAPPTLFKKAYIDTIMMLKSKGYQYLVHTHDKLSLLPEAMLLKRENAQMLGKFIFEQLPC